MTDRIKRYIRHKKNLGDYLADLNGPLGDCDQEYLGKLEKKLEFAFEEVLDFQPEKLSDVLAKAELFISEVLSEAELAQFQVESLKNVVDDLRTFTKQ